MTFVKEGYLHYLIVNLRH